MTSGSGITHRITTDHAYMCEECTTMRWGDPQEPCPTCGEEDVAIIEFDDGGRR